MDIQTAWLKSVPAKSGRDHLGVQGPCINIYGQLLPGITNVTDRARYYSFYPWFFWSCRQHYKEPTWKYIIERFRRADCLFTLIAARHSKKSNEPENYHGIGMVGRNTLVPLLEILEKESSIKLSTYATLDGESKYRYFMNKLGGLGQYYLGPLSELGLLAGNSNKGVKYTPNIGADVARAFEEKIDRSLFFKCIDDDYVSLDILDKLYAFCPCQLKNSSNEQKALIDLFFDRKLQYGTSGLRRKQTLGLYLNLIKQIEDSDLPFDHYLFRDCVYSGFLPGGDAWLIPNSLSDICKAWKVYQKNELISIAMQGIFWACLCILEEQQAHAQRFLSVESFINWLTQYDAIKTAVGNKLSDDFSSALKKTERHLPLIEEVSHDLHEIHLANNIIQQCKASSSIKNPTEIIKSAIIILINIILRENEDFEPYGDISLPEDYLWYYPINLVTFRDQYKNEWCEQKLSEVVAFLMTWCIETHFHVALRKLRYDSQDTFQICPTENGLQWESTPEPIYTNPRFTQGVRMLWDLDLINPKEEGRSFELTSLGHSILKEISDN